MIKELEDRIVKTTSLLRCSPEEKREIQLELKDHLYSAYEYYVEQGTPNEEAIQQVLLEFGNTNTICNQYQQVVNPLYGWMKKIAMVSFIIYSFVVLWKVVFSRLIVRIYDYVNADGPHYIQYVYSNASTWEGKQFFDFSMWQSNVNLNPLEMIMFYVKAEHINTDIAIHNLLGNIILLLPLGVFLPFIYLKCKNLLSVTAISFCTSLAIEVIQFSLQIGMTDIDDVLLNTLGAMIGYFIAVVIYKLFSWKRKWRQPIQLS